MHTEQVQIQVQDHSGVWRTVSWVTNNSYRVVSEMRTVKKQYPDYRVRAVDADGRIVDILT